MKTILIKAWQSLTPRHRGIISLLLILLAAWLYLWQVDAAMDQRTLLQTSLTTLRGQAAQLDRQALEIERLRRLPKAAPAPGEIRTLLQARIGEAGLQGTLVNIDVVDDNQAKVVFAALPFAAWVAWVEGLQTQGIRLISARVEPLATPGLVNVSASFARSRS